MIRDLFLANVIAIANVPCPRAQTSIDALAREFRGDRAHMLDRLRSMPTADLHELLMVAWARAPLAEASGKSREEWLALLDAEASRLSEKSQRPGTPFLRFPV